MSAAESILESRIAEMRRRFDESFAHALPEPAAKLEPMLAITVEGEPFALRAREISGLAVNREKIVPVPSRVPELLGLTGIRGVVVPVFSLARLLGFEAERGPALWLIFCGERQAPIALAFEAMERLFEASAADIFARQDAPAPRFVNATLAEGTTLRGVISIAALVEYIRTRGARK
jgi:purine-binding chemotaxis protein CheW